MDYGKCFCGDVRDEHEAGGGEPCTIEGCGCTMFDPDLEDIDG